VEEVKGLARAMTYKYCFLKRATGGAKAGIVLPLDCALEQKTKILETFGRQASFLLKNNTYNLWTDLNSCNEDIATILKSAGCEFHGMSDSAFFTALTVVSALKAACKTKGIALSDASVLIEGFGNVGEQIAADLSKLGAKIVGISTMNGSLYNRNGLDVTRLQQLRKKYMDDLVHYYGSEFFEEKERLLEKTADVLIPCARAWTINATNMKNIHVKIIAPGANIPLTKDAEEYMNQQGILVLPDFICNIGGILGTSLYDGGNRLSTIRHFVMDEFGLLVKELILRSIKENCVPSKVAEAIAQKNCAAITRTIDGSFLIKKSVIRLHGTVMYGLRLRPGVRSILSLWVEKRILFENIRSIQHQSL
jgi:glutamate dehydrogenase/leucine dehydrogenase